MKANNSYPLCLVLISIISSFGYSWGWDSTQLYPPIMSPWAKMEMGWLQPEEITKSGRYTLSPSAVNPKAYKVSQGFPNREYILIENRQPLLFDEKEES